jgi:hypothetical protein
MKKLIALSLALAPLSTFAQINNINDISAKATNIGTLVVTLLISFSVIWIIVNVVRYLIAGGEESRKKAGPAILWGIVGLFVILSIWGLVAILKNSFGTGRNTLQDPTQVPVILNAPPVQI